MTLTNGACLYPARNIDLFNPVQYIQKNRLTIWHSVPSLANIAVTNNMLEPGCLDSLRVSIFNGEALTRTLAEQWQKSVSGGEIWNFYGPTECAVAVSCEKYTNNKPDIFSGNNIAIGRFFKGCEAAIICNDEIIRPEDFYEGITGELLISGTQLFDGYIGNINKTPFVRDKKTNRYYRTGDMACWKNNRFFLLGRLDQQVKISGHRIEIMEVEHRLKDFFKTELLAVIAIPAEKPIGLLLFSELKLDIATITQDSTGLPSYMIPKNFIPVQSLPLNQNGKIDRKALSNMHENLA